MILFVSHYPDPVSEKDGMMQRVAAIDKHFASRERVYLDLSYIRNIIPVKRVVSKKLSVYSINLFLYLPLIVYFAVKAKCIYVHSIGNAQFILPFYLFKNIITDMHGVAPEEFRYSGRRFVAFRYNIVESLAIRSGGTIVTVTTAMSDHFRNKYKRNDLTIVNIPLFDDIAINKNHAFPKKHKLTIIYAGGSQKWQNVDLMFSLMKIVGDKFRFVILTGAPEVFAHKVKEHDLRCSIEIKSVPKQEVQAYYLAADLGFVLRDDTLVNKVACPTKLMEYMASGVIPVVIQPCIGDFDELGYAYVTTEQLISGYMPTNEEMEKMRSNNYRIVEAMQRNALLEVRKMVARCSA